MDGRMGIGAPFAHVDRLVAAGLAFGLAASGVGVVLWVTGAGRDACSGSIGAGLSLPIRDLLNHEGLDVRLGGSLGSFDDNDLKLLSDCFRPSNLDDDFGLRGSAASIKYSWFKACVDVGLFFGSHIRQAVTKLLSEVGHCEGCKILSIEWGAIYTIKSASVLNDCNFGNSSYLWE